MLKLLQYKPLRCCLCNGKFLRKWCARRASNYCYKLMKTNEYIYKIKNAELIKAFLPEEGIGWTMEAVRKCILLDSKTSVTLDYEEEGNGTDS